APACADAYRPVPGKPTPQRMQLPTGNIHCPGPGGFVQRGQLAPQTTGVSRLDATGLAGQKEPFDALVPERSDHQRIVSPDETTFQHAPVRRCGAHARGSNTSTSSPPPSAFTARMRPP